MESTDVVELILGNSFKERFQIKKVFLKHNQCFFDHFIGIFMGGLNFHLDTVLQGVSLSVTCELDVLVFEEVDAHQISNGMVFQGNTIGHAVYHFLPLDDVDSLFGEFLFVMTTQLQSEVLTHKC